MAAGQVNDFLNTNDKLVDIEDSRPLPGIDWQIDVDVEQAGRYGANVATVGAMVQLVTRGILLDTMQVDTSDEEIEIRVRYPEDDRVLSTLDEMRVRTADGLIPLSNFITRKPVPKLAEINRHQTERRFVVRAGVVEDENVQVQVDKVTSGLVLRQLLPEEATLADIENLIADARANPDGALFDALVNWLSVNKVWAAETLIMPIDGDDATTAPIGDPAVKTDAALLETEEYMSAISTLVKENLVDFVDPLPSSVKWELAGDQEEQAESQAFLGQAFLGALGLMFVILLAQFNSLYNSIVVLLAVILSVTGVLIGMLVMDQTFSIIMTGTGVVALALRHVSALSCSQLSRQWRDWPR